LVNCGDSASAGRGWGKAVNLVAVNFDGAGVGLMSAGDDLDQRRFACAVLAEEGVDFTGTKIEGNAF